mgnify:CR=1 FL=1
MSNAEIVPIGDKRVATSTDFESPGDRLIAMAVETGADVDKLEKLIALKNQEEERAARRAFDVHFTAMQAEFTAVAKGKQGHGYKYCPIEVLQKHYNGAITSHGFSYRWREEAIDLGKRCIMRISGWGHAEENTFDIPVLAGTNRMNDVQAAGAMSTYGRRYTFVAGFGVIIEDEDDDAGSLPRHYPSTTTVQRAPKAAPPPGDIRQCRRDIEGLIERYQSLISEQIIDAVKLDMESAKTYPEMHSIYVDLKSAGEKKEKEEESASDTKGEAFKKAAAAYADKENAGETEDIVAIKEKQDRAEQGKPSLMDKVEAKVEENKGGGEPELGIF